MSVSKDLMFERMYESECRCPAGGMTDTERDLFGEPPPCPACIDDEYLRLMGLTREDAEAEFEAYIADLPFTI